MKQIKQPPLFQNERQSEQAHIPHAPTLLENTVYNEWQFQALGMGNLTKKGICIAPQKDQISISCKNAYQEKVLGRQ